MNAAVGEARKLLASKALRQFRTTTATAIHEAGDVHVGE
jgi:hypothetical protein